MTGHPPGESPWTPAKIQRLKDMWGKAKTSEICDALGMNRNQILGKAHRLKLPNLGSPIKRIPTAEDPTTPKSIPHQLGAQKARKTREINAKVLDFKPAAAPRPAPPPARHRISSRDTCAWPFGDPREPGFHFCGLTPVVPGKPYCLDHCHQAYKTPEQAARERADAMKRGAA